MARNNGKESAVVFEPSSNRLNRKRVRKPAAETSLADTNPPAPTIRLAASPQAKKQASETVRQMRRRGLTVQQIVDLLNARQVPRPDGRPWIARMVEGLLSGKDQGQPIEED